MRSDGRSRPSWLLLDDGTAVVESAQAIGLPLLGGVNVTRCARRVAGSGSCCSPCWPSRPTALLVCVGGTATVDGGAAMREVVGGRLRGVPIRVLCDVRNPLLGTRGAARVFGPQKGADAARQSRCSKPGSADWRSSCRTATCRARGRAAVSALRSPRSAPSSSKEQRSCSTRSVSTNVRATPTSSSPARGWSTRRRWKARRPGAVVRRCKQLGVRCELFGGIVRGGMRAHALSGRRARAGDDLRPTGRGASRVLWSTRASSSIFPRTLSSFAAQIA